MKMQCSSVGISAQVPWVLVLVLGWLGHLSGQRLEAVVRKGQLHKKGIFLEFCNKLGCLENLPYLFNFLLCFYAIYFLWLVNILVFLRKVDFYVIFPKLDNLLNWNVLVIRKYFLLRKRQVEKKYKTFFLFQNQLLEILFSK